MSLSHVVLVLIQRGQGKKKPQIVLANLPLLSHRGCEEVLEVRADNKTAKDKSEAEKKPFPFP